MSCQLTLNSQYLIMLPFAFPATSSFSTINCYLPTVKAHSALFKSVRLACVRHAASVRPEPGSNSLLNNSNISLDMSLTIKSSSELSQSSCMHHSLCLTGFPVKHKKQCCPLFAGACSLRCLISKVRLAFLSTSRIQLLFLWRRCNLAGFCVTGA